MNSLDLVIVFSGFVVITVLSLLIAARVKKHLGNFYAPFTHLFVLVIALYYLIDIAGSKQNLLAHYYFYLWIVVLVTQLYLFYMRKKF